MKLKRFCSKCGKIFTEDETIYEGFLCSQCYGLIEEHIDLPQNYQLRHCIQCGAFSLRLDTQEFPWEYQTGNETEIDFITRQLYEHLLYRLEKKTDLQFEIFFKSNMKLTQEADISFIIQGFKGDQVKYQENDLHFRTREISCPHCAKKTGGRFDAIVQIRIQHSRNEADLSRIIEEIQHIEKSENMVNLSSFITRIEKTINGFDLKVSTNVMARALIARLKAKFHFEIKHSKRLMGVEQTTGGDLYRQSTLLRLVPVQKDDQILLEGKLFTVKNITKNKIVLQSPQESKKVQVNFDVFQKKKWSFFSGD